jgi:hypothetical protein
MLAQWGVHSFSDVSRTCIAVSSIKLYEDYQCTGNMMGRTCSHARDTREIHTEFWPGSVRGRYFIRP